jgi:NADPH2:quinone reductase
MKLIQVSELGGPEVLKLTEKSVPTPNADEVLVRLEAIGVNFIDIYHRTGLYPLPLPFTPGMEGAGRVEDLGPDVTGLKKGDRVAWAMRAGSYAEYANVPASRLVRVPDSVSSEQAAAAMLQGMTAHYLTTSVYHLKRGDWAIVHAAAGGVGLLLIQLAKRVGANVIGTVSTEEKAKLAREAGADEIINYRNQDFESESRRITNGSGVNVVYDSVGRDTFMKSLGALAPRGMLALFGQSSGPVPPFDPALLLQKGSLFLTRPSLAHYTLTREELEARARDIFEWIQSGQLRIDINHRFPLSSAAEAHAALEGRKTTGKVLLIP